jgi:large conductance mechanosensitive channel
MLKDFKAFVMRGNVPDLAVAVVVGGAFAKIVTSSWTTSPCRPWASCWRVDFRAQVHDLSGQHPATLAQAQAMGAAVLLVHGLFINAIVNFLIVAFAIFLVLHSIKRFRPAAGSGRTGMPVLPP